MAHEILERNEKVEKLGLIGIRTRGAHLVRRIAQKIESFSGIAPPASIIDVTPYRDDLEGRGNTANPSPVEVPLSLDEKTIVLIDDVIYTGRTIRAALDLITHLGKPKRIFVAVLVDRGSRELPIKADIVGKNVRVSGSERINVLLRESDGVDQVIVTKDQRRAFRQPSNPRRETT